MIPAGRCRDILLSEVAQDKTLLLLLLIKPCHLPVWSGLTLLFSPSLPSEFGSQFANRHMHTDICMYTYIYFCLYINPTPKYILIYMWNRNVCICKLTTKYTMNRIIHNYIINNRNHKCLYKIKWIKNISI